MHFGDRFRRHEPGSRIAAGAVVLEIGKKAHLVLRRGLQREASGVVPQVLVGNRGSGEIRRVDGRALGLVEELACNLVLVTGFAKRAEEPQPVLADWTAKRCVEAVNVESLVDGRQAPCTQRVGQVVALQMLVRVQARETATEGVATLLRNHVHGRAAGRALR